VYLKRGQGYSATGICQALGLSRTALRYRLGGKVAIEAQRYAEEQVIKGEIENIVLEYPGYGYRRVTRELGKKGFRTNHKKILGIMKKYNLLCKIRRKKRFVRTTDSNHGLPIYPNLIKEASPTYVNQIWVADITYVRLPHGFCYLAVILDAYSRKAVGWSVRLDISENLALEALSMALQNREYLQGLIHHSDQGVQYASSRYTGLLKESGILISMSRKGNPYDNSKAESFMSTIKSEEVYLNDYDNYEEAKLRIDSFISDVYNRKRMHSSLDYLSPEEFEEVLLKERISVLN
jgi:putative transposase